MENRDMCFRFWAICSLLLPAVFHRFKKKNQKNPNEVFITKITLVKISVLHFIILTWNQQVQEEHEITILVLVPGSSVPCGKYLTLRLSGWLLTPVKEKDTIGQRSQP